MSCFTITSKPLSCQESTRKGAAWVGVAASTLSPHNIAGPCQLWGCCLPRHALHTVSPHRAFRAEITIVVCVVVAINWSHRQCWHVCALCSCWGCILSLWGMTCYAWKVRTTYYAWKVRACGMLLCGVWVCPGGTDDDESHLLNGQTRNGSAWEVWDGLCKTRWKGTAHGCYRSSNERWACMTSRDCTLRVWCLQEGMPQAALLSPGRPFCVCTALDPDPYGYAYHVCVTIWHCRGT